MIWNVVEKDGKLSLIEKGTEIPEGSVIVTETANPEYLNIKPPVCDSITMRQARLALLRLNLLGAVNAALNSIPDKKEREAALIEWEYAQTIDRNSPLVISLSRALGLSDSDLDNLFASASSI
jgi:hypothetical protein